MENRGENMRCPACGCLSFYVKNPDDEYETYEFDLKGGNIVFHAEADGHLKDETETYCNKCAWHGQFRELKNTGK